MTVDLDLTVPLRPCTPWCDDPDGHPRNHPEDRRCWSPSVVVPMRLMRAVEMVDGEWWLDRLDLYLQRRPDEDVTRVLINHEPSGEYLLTLEEAAELRDALTSLLERA